MLGQELSEVSIGPLRIVEVELGIELFFSSEESSGVQAGAVDEGFQLGEGGRCLQILDDRGFDATLTEEGKRVAGSATGGVVIDGDGRHGLPGRVVSRADAGQGLHDFGSLF